jgi:iron complex transport system substrate-binding protein
MRIGGAVLIAVIGCQVERTPSTGSGRTLRDDFGDVLALDSPPQRIVSLNPATTAMLFAMGAGERIVGRTRWDNYPPAALAVADLGDGLRPNVEAVLAVHPDLVLLYASADNRDAARRLRAAGIATLSVRVDRVADFRRTMGMLGLVLHDSLAAAHVVDTVDASLERVRSTTANLSPVRVIWQIDAAPFRVIGGGSYLNELLADANAINLYADLSSPSPEVSLEDVLRRDPDAVLTTGNGDRSIRADPRWRQWLSRPDHRILVPDTALVGMPSIRMGEAVVQLAGLLHPSAAGAGQR